MTLSDATSASLGELSVRFGVIKEHERAAIARQLEEAVRRGEPSSMARALLQRGVPRGTLERVLGAGAPLESVGCDACGRLMSMALFRRREAQPCLSCGVELVGFRPFDSDASADALEGEVVGSRTVGYQEILVAVPNQLEPLTDSETTAEFDRLLTMPEPPSPSPHAPPVPPSVPKPPTLPAQQPQPFESAVQPVVIRPAIVPPTPPSSSPPPLASLADLPGLRETVASPEVDLVMGGEQTASIGSPTEQGMTAFPDPMAEMETYPPQAPPPELQGLFSAEEQTIPPQHALGPEINKSTGSRRRPARTNGAVALPAPPALWPWVLGLVVLSAAAVGLVVAHALV